jgi:glycosyltransferase involved in cell wall biosynthesis
MSVRDRVETGSPAVLSREAAGRAKPKRHGQVIVVAVPAYNEARFIGSVVLSAARYADVVLVVDDGSSDRTADLAEAAGALVVRHAENGGKGRAINTAFREARRLGATALVLIDGDGQHEPGEIEAVARPVLAGEADMVVGSRFLGAGNQIPTYRKFGQHGLTLATNLASGAWLTDSQSGFRAFSAAALEALRFRAEDFSVESEMQFLAREHGLRIAEAPISVVYREPAKRNPVNHGMVVLNGIIRLVSMGRPLFFFGGPGLFIMLAGLAVGLLVVHIYNTTMMLAVGYTLISVLMTIIGALALLTGVMLHAMRALVLEVRATKGQRGDDSH